MMGAGVCAGFITAKALYLFCTGGSSVISSKEFVCFDSQELHFGIAGPPKACRLTMGL